MRLPVTKEILSSLKASSSLTSSSLSTLANVLIRSPSECTLLHIDFGSDGNRLLECKTWEGVNPGISAAHVEELCWDAFTKA